MRQNAFKGGFGVGNTAQEQRALKPPRCWSLPSKTTSLGHSFKRSSHTALKVLPLSNHTSKMWGFFSNLGARCLKFSGNKSLTSASHHALHPFLAKMLLMCSKMAGSSRGSWLSLSKKNAIGTPQLLWRDTHQSGRCSIIALRRFLPCGGKLHLFNRL